MKGDELLEAKKPDIEQVMQAARESIEKIFSDTMRELEIYYQQQIGAQEVP